MKTITAIPKLMIEIDDLYCEDGNGNFCSYHGYYDDTIFQECKLFRVKLHDDENNICLRNEQCINEFGC